jgi:hypothetical protein
MTCEMILLYAVLPGVIGGVIGSLLASWAFNRWRGG